MSTIIEQDDKTRLWHAHDEAGNRLVGRKFRFQAERDYDDYCASLGEPEFDMGEEMDP